MTKLTDRTRPVPAKQAAGILEQELGIKFHP